MKKLERLRKPYEFKSVLDTGTKIVNPKLILFGMQPSAPQAAARLGLIVSRKVGNAVVRNQVKRRLRAGFDRIKTRLDGLDVVIIARPGISQSSSADIDLAFAECADRLQHRLGFSSASATL